MTEIKLYKSNKKVLKLFLLAAPLIAAGIWMILREDGTQTDRIMGWVGTIFFGLAIPVGLFHLFDIRPQVIINEIGIYEMSGAGLRSVDNPSEILVTNTDPELSGIAISSTLEGLRPFLIEIQALVSSAAYGTPQRSSTGFDAKRLNMLLAVLEKRCGFKLGAKDVFLNIAGGIKVDDPGVDLAVTMAVLSSNANLPIPPGIAFSAEVGLSGEIRPVNRIDQRIAEVEKLGYKKIIISKNSKGFDTKNYKIEVIQCSKIDQVVKAVFA